MSRPIKTAILGSGFGTRVLLPALARSGDFQVTTLCARNVDKLREPAQAYSVPRVVADWHVLLEDPEVEAVIAITDGEIVFPEEEPPYSVLWVLTQESEFAPGYGHILPLRL